MSNKLFDNFKWTDDALLNLQLISARIMGKELEDWTSQAEFCKHLAIRFTLNEPIEWEEADYDYETTIEMWCNGRNPFTKDLPTRYDNTSD